MKMFIALLLVFLFSLPGKTHALSFPTSLGFGGYVVASVPCTCPPFGMNIYYKPLFLNSGIPIVGALYYPPGALVYSFFQLGVPTTWELGAFVPGGFCSILNPANAVIGNPDPCAPPIVLPAFGSILYVGTSRPGALPSI